MADQYTWRVRWTGVATEAADAEDGPHIAMVRASEGGIAKLERYMDKAPGVHGDWNIERLHGELLTVQEFIDWRRSD